MKLDDFVLSKQTFVDAINQRIALGEFYLNPVQVESAGQFAEILHRENKLQNLTRIIGVEEFIDGHLIDVIHLFNSQQLADSVLDIGSGCGVPGLLAASIDLDRERIWYLCDSERNKADFLFKAASEMKLNQVKIYSNRVERILNDVRPKTIMARAVGTVDKIAGWIIECSTWNNLILFKSRGWEIEWSSAQKTRFGKKLTITHIHEYSSSDKYRVIVSLSKN